MRIKISVNTTGRLIVIGWVMSIVIFSGLEVSAQIVRTKTPVRKTYIFKGNSVAREEPEVAKFRKFAPPPELNEVNQSALFSEVLKANGVALKEGASLPTETYAVLSNRNPYYINKAGLDFFKALKVDSLIGAGVFDAGKFGFDVNLKPDHPGKWFMISCGINTGPKSVFSIAGPDGSSYETILDGSGYLNLYLHSQNTEWQKLKIRRVDDGYWSLISCRITTAKST